MRRIPSTPLPVAMKASGLRALLAAMMLCACAWAQTNPASRPASGLAEDDPSADAQQIIRHFDFDERKFGNFEELPRDWGLLTGAGLPHYSRATIDPNVGCAAAPSVRFDLEGGNIGLAYEGDDIRVTPTADYRVVVSVRTQGLRHARTFLCAYFVDRGGDALPGTHRISRLTPPIHREEAAADAGGADGGCTMVDVVLTETPAAAYALRMELWLVQDEAWRTPDTAAVDPIQREDVAGTAWFDDLTVFRIPQVRLELSAPGGVIVAGQSAKLNLMVQNPAPEPIDATLDLVTADGTVTTTFEAHAQRRGVLSQSFPLPALPPGEYRVHLHARSKSTRLLEREIGFTVVSLLPDTGVRYGHFGVSLPRHPGADAGAWLATLSELRVGAAKLTVPMVPNLTRRDEVTYFDTLRELAAMLAGRQVDVCGVMVGPIDETERTTLTARQLASPHEEIPARIGGALAKLSGLITTWQLGDERTEIRSRSAWDAGAVAALAAGFDRFVTLPRFVLPGAVRDSRHADPALQAVLAPPRPAGGAPTSAPSNGEGSNPVQAADVGALDLTTPPGIEGLSLLAPDGLSARSTVWALAFLREEEARSAAKIRPYGRLHRWVQYPSLAGAAPGRFQSDEDLVELAQKVVLTRAAGVERAYWPAPIEYRDAAGVAGWQPTPEYPILRTLFHFLSGRELVRVVNLPEESVGLLFAGPTDAVLVAWTQAVGPARMVSLYDLGEAAKGWDVWGRPQTVERADQRSRFSVSRMPLIISNVNRPLVELQAGLTMGPPSFQPTDSSPLITVEFENPYPEPLIARGELVAPRDWTLTPSEFEVVLKPGERAVNEIAVTLPPIPFASQDELTLFLNLRRPEQRTLIFRQPAAIGLNDVRVSVDTTWRGGALIVRHTVQNLSKDVLSFTSYCQAPGYRRQEGAFLRIVPGDARSQEYIFPGAARLTGMEMVLGLEEIGGLRRLNHRVQVSTPPDSAP
jgi:hypothetical protein